MPLLDKNMKKKEYIEREVAIAETRKPRLTDAELRRRLASIPAADVRPVVTCIECKYAPIGDKDGSDLEWPFNEFDENPCPYKCLDNWYSHKPAPDFFCAAGVNREES